MLTRLGGNLFFPIIPIINMGLTHMRGYETDYAVMVRLTPMTHLSSV